MDRIESQSHAAQGVPDLAGVHLPPRPEVESCTFECVSRAERRLFIAQRDLLPAHLNAFLTPYSLESYEEGGVHLYLHRSMKGGYGLKDGELISVFSLPGEHLGRELILDAVARGATHLDCLGANEFLPRLYASCGFQEVSRLQWDDAYAPSDWDYSRFGRPDVVFMRLESSAEATEPRPVH